MSQANPAQNQALIEYKVDRVLDETNTDTKIIVLARQDGRPDSFPIWVGATEGHAIKLALDTTMTPRPLKLSIKRAASSAEPTSRRLISTITSPAVTPSCSATLSPTRRA